MRLPMREIRPPSDPKMFRRSAIGTGVVLGVLTALMFTFQNCGQFQGAMGGSSSSSSIFRKSCSEINPKTEACIFYKGPLYQPEGTLTSEQLNSRTVAQLQSYVIDLPSTSFDQIEGTGIEIHPQDPTINPKNLTGDDRIAQLMAWYWGSQAADFMQSANGQSILFKSLRIFPMAQTTGYSSASKSILLKKRVGGASDSFDASILVQLMGEAFVTTASGQLSLANTDATHVDCGEYGGAVYFKSCCKDETGCSKAIRAGLADYLVSRVFPQSPSIGDSVAADPSGMKLCSQSRNPSLTKMSATAVYKACAGDGAPGEVYAMGSYYSSIWYGVRARVEANSKLKVSDFDRFYVEAMGLLGGEDTFQTFQAKLQKLDDAKYKSQFVPLFVEEIGSRI